MEHIAEAVKQAQAHLREHPAEARYPDSEAIAVIADGLRCTVSGPNGESIETDMPVSVGGSAMAPPPGWYMRAAAASCVGTLIVMRAAELGKTVGGLSVTAGGDSDDRGILGVDEAIPSGPFSMGVVISADGIAEDDLREIAEWAVAHCPVTDAIARAVPIRMSVKERPPAGEG
jgi:uncharacterized OsmC-like protein